MVRVGDREVFWRDGMTVADLLSESGDSYPYAAVRFNGRLVARPEFDRTSVPDNCEVFALPLIAGG